MIDLHNHLILQVDNRWEPNEASADPTTIIRGEFYDDHRCPQLQISMPEAAAERRGFPEVDASCDFFRSTLASPSRPSFGDLVAIILLDASCRGRANNAFACPHQVHGPRVR
jgi:hypothetical protein